MMIRQCLGSLALLRVEVLRGSEAGEGSEGAGESLSGGGVLEIALVISFLPFRVRLGLFFRFLQLFDVVDYGVSFGFARTFDKTENVVRQLAIAHPQGLPQQVQLAGLAPELELLHESRPSLDFQWLH